MALEALLNGLLGMSVRETYRLLREKLEAAPAALATVVRTKGSTPREVGAKMIIDPTSIHGTIGGGCGEAEVVQVARELLSSGDATRRLVRVDLTETAWETSDRICGGVMDVLIESWTASTPHLVAIGERDELIRIVPLDDRPALLWTPKGGADGTDGAETDDVSAACVKVWNECRSRTLEEAERSGHFVEIVSAENTLIVCGAGHIAEPLVAMASMLGMKVVVIDDRPEYANVERFPAARIVLACAFGEALSSIEITKRCLVVLVTRGHRHDEACLRALLRTDASYIGMLGSRRRVRAILDELRAEGIPSEAIDRIWAPIGIDIGAHTPAEIAVSILAEVIALQRERTGNHAHLRQAAPRRRD